MVSALGAAPAWDNETQTIPGSIPIEFYTMPHMPTDSDGDGVADVDDRFPGYDDAGMGGQGRPGGR